MHIYVLFNAHSQVPTLTVQATAIAQTSRKPPLLSPFHSIPPNPRSPTKPTPTSKKQPHAPHYAAPPLLIAHAPAPTNKPPTKRVAPFAPSHGLLAALGGYVFPSRSTLGSQVQRSASETESCFFWSVVCFGRGWRLEVRVWVCV